MLQSPFFQPWPIVPSFSFPSTTAPSPFGARRYSCSLNPSPCTSAFFLTHSACRYLPLFSTSISSHACRSPPPPATVQVPLSQFKAVINNCLIFFTWTGLVPINYYVRISTGCCTIAYTCIALYPLIPRRLQTKPLFAFLISSFPRLLSVSPSRLSLWPPSCLSLFIPFCLLPFS